MKILHTLLLMVQLGLYRDLKGQNRKRNFTMGVITTWDILNMKPERVVRHIQNMFVDKNYFNKNIFRFLCEFYPEQLIVRHTVRLGVRISHITLFSRNTEKSHRPQYPYYFFIWPLVMLRLMRSVLYLQRDYRYIQKRKGSIHSMKKMKLVIHHIW